ncbi:cytidine deaminase, putative [Plasmodium vivax]|uniref:Cytidine deaminase, putative n=1 Tax=Plasmodium vivax TaxID=5855 RepID=A0A1G4HI84_PLAVI|nr:cytidine deaminase, putative [Plasmodium vivax]
MMDSQIVDIVQVYPDSYTQEIELTPMYCLETTKDNTKGCLNVMRDFVNSQLRNSYNHLKRCRKVNEENVQILVGFSAELPDDLLSKVVQINGGKPITITMVHASKHPPMTRKQYAEWSVHWPLYYRKPANELTTLAKEDVKKFIHFVKIAIRVGKNFGTCQGGCVLTHNHKIIACSGDNIKNHPLHHAVMLAIEQVSFKLRHLWRMKKEVHTRASDCNGNTTGCITNHVQNAHTSECLSGPSNKKCKIGSGEGGSASGGSTPYLKCEAADEGEEVDGGAADGTADRTADRTADGTTDGEDLTRLSLLNPVEDDQYLCTNYYAYLSHEPCFMCAMAMVHSRVKCVIFDEVNRDNGALFSRAKLHCVKNLNHHFKVYRTVRNKS